MLPHARRVRGLKVSVLEFAWRPGLAQATPTFVPTPPLGQRWAGLWFCAPQGRHGVRSQHHPRPVAAQVCGFCQALIVQSARPPAKLGVAAVFLWHWSQAARAPRLRPRFPSLTHTSLICILPIPLCPSHSRPPAAVLSALGRSLQFEMAVGQNGRVWVDAPRCVWQLRGCRQPVRSAGWGAWWGGGYIVCPVPLVLGWNSAGLLGLWPVPCRGTHGHASAAPKPPNLHPCCSLPRFHAAPLPWCWWPTRCRAASS